MCPALCSGGACLTASVLLLDVLPQLFPLTPRTAEECGSSGAITTPGGAVPSELKNRLKTQIIGLNRSRVINRRKVDN